MIDDEGLKNLEKLHQLKTDGVITEADFEAAKAKLLSQAPAAKAKAMAPTPARFDGTLPDEGDHFGWMLLPLRRYADFTGRSCRREFWMFYLLIGLATAAALILAAIGKPDYALEEPVFSNAVLGIWGLGIIGVLIPMLAVQVRRFHDQGKSGWFALFNLLPYLGSLIVLIFMVLPGTEGDNQYGPDPLS